jgi:hypothetical protein
MTRSALLRTFLAAALLSATATALVLRVPTLREQARTAWHAWRCPSLPEERTTFSAAGMPVDPWPVRGNGPNLHVDLRGTADTSLVDGHSAALVRRVGDVADSLVAIGFGVELRCTDPHPDIRLCLRIDAADGSSRAWNEKRLRPDEHRPGNRERFNFEWILRERRPAPDDRVSAFVRQAGGEAAVLYTVDLVFRSAAPQRPR